MGNYLKSAANRALGRAASAVQPRLPSLFEPPTVPLSARFTQFAVTPAESEIQPSFTPERSFEPARERMPQPQTSIPVGRRADREVSPHAEPANHIPANHEESRPAPTFAVQPKKPSIQPIVPASDLHQQSAFSVTSIPKAQQSAKPVKTSQEIEPETSTRIESRQPARSVRPDIPESKQAFQAKTVERHVERSVVKEVVERVRRVQAETAPARQPDIQAGLIRPVATAHQTTFSNHEPVEDTRPVINVVIGRVSVNAVTERPAVAARASQPPGPMLSLDRYLEQRRGRS